MDDKTAWNNFELEVTKADRDINLAKAALYFSQAEYPYLDIEAYLNKLLKISQAIELQLPATRYPLQVIKVINNHLYKELGFAGNTENYYDPKNSFLNQVIDRRLGIPISLAVIYLDIAKHLNFPMVGIGMPGHFLIRPDFEEAGFFIDVFNQGEILFSQDCEAKLQQLYLQPVKLKPEFLNPVSSRTILTRMLNNLKQIYLHYRDFNRAISTINGILILSPDNPYELRNRGLIYYELNRWQESSQDLESYLAILPNAEDAPMIQMLLNKINY
ncbi:MAG: transglutaminase-like domain-containing protein [Xenococcaceae cyanobacterium MO_188.B19]|nr:transglutaminase-like domain-containing protein [Xenococcaceae cyanobacterium MO_188.B19]